MVHGEHKGGAWFADDAAVVSSAERRGWKVSDPPADEQAAVRTVVPSAARQPKVRVAAPTADTQPVVNTGIPSEPANPGGANKPTRGTKKGSE